MVPPTTIDIASHSNAILIVRKAGTRLKADTHQMRAAPQVFAAIFSPNSSEGRKLSYETPNEVILEEDDGTAMETICRVIHYKSKSAAETSQAWTLLAIAELVEIYLMHDACVLEVHGVNVGVSSWCYYLFLTLEFTHHSTLQ
jgi:hypothetical protein